jgi:hypothetical protein
MQIIDLYKYEESNGVVTITPNKRNEIDTPSRARLVADKGAILTNGTTEVEVRDVMLNEINLWTEIEHVTSTNY